MLNGRWYIIDNEYEEIVNEKFKRIYNTSKRQKEDIISKFPSLKTNWLNIKKEGRKVPEDDFNKAFKCEKDIICAHRIYPKGAKQIEIADLIFYDDDKKILYLLCAKKKFDAGV